MLPAAVTKSSFSTKVRGEYSVRQVATRPSLQQIFTGQGVVVATTTPAEFSKFLEDDRTQWAAVIRAAGIKPD